VAYRKRGAERREPASDDGINAACKGGIFDEQGKSDPPPTRLFRRYDSER
jgi:hypothetical protein